MAGAAGNPSSGPDYGLDTPAIVKDWWHRAGWFGAIALAAWFVNHDQYPAVSARLFAVLAALGGMSAGVAWLKIQSSRQGKLRLRDELLDQLELKGDEKVLDVGCGTGLMTIGAAKRMAKAGRVTGVNTGLGEDSLDAAKANGKTEQTSDRIVWESCPQHRLHHRNETFDVAMSVNALHRLADDNERRQALREMLRVLKPEGRLLIFDTADTGFYAEVLRSEGAKDVRLSPWKFLWCLPSRSITARKP